MSQNIDTKYSVLMGHKTSGGGILQTQQWTFLNDHDLMIHYEKYNQHVHTEICKFIVEGTAVYNTINVHIRTCTCWSYCSQKWIFGFHKRWWISWVTRQSAASQHRIHSMNLKVSDLKASKTTTHKCTKFI